MQNSTKLTYSQQDANISQLVEKLIKKLLMVFLMQWNLEAFLSWRQTFLQERFVEDKKPSFEPFLKLLLVVKEVCQDVDLLME